MHFTVRLPERADLRLETVNGPVEIEDVTGKLEAQTVNGVLRVSGHRGSVNAQTVNGRIESALEEMAAGTRHSFRTVNGRVDLTLGPEARGKVDARAVNGRVILELLDEPRHLDPPTRGRKSVQVGEGGGECRVRTVNGAIRVAARAGSGS